MGTAPGGTLPLVRTLRLTGAFPSGELPVAPVSFELSSGLPLLMISSGDPFLPLAGSLDLAGTEVLLSIPPASILKIVLPFVALAAGSSPELQSSSYTTLLPLWNSIIVLRLVSRNSNGIGVSPSLGWYNAFLICLWTRINSTLASSSTHSSSVAKASSLCTSSCEELPRVF